MFYSGDCVDDSLESDVVVARKSFVAVALVCFKAVIVLMIH